MQTIDCHRKIVSSGISLKKFLGTWGVIRVNSIIINHTLNNKSTMNPATAELQEYPVKKIKEVMDKNAHVDIYLDNFKVVMNSKKTPLQIYQDIMALIGKGKKYINEEEIKQQILAVLDQIKAEKTRFIQQLHTDDKQQFKGCLLFFNLEKNDQIALSCKIAYFSVDFSKEWFFQKWKQQKIIEAILSEMTIDTLRDLSPLPSHQPISS